MNLGKGISILWRRITQQGLRVTALWAADHAARVVTGANLLRVSEVAPGLHVGGQYRPRGWPRLAARGVTVVVNLREEWEYRPRDGAGSSPQKRGIAPPRHLRLPTPDDGAPSLDALAAGAAFISEELARGGGALVHCGAGVGRAPTMAAAYLVSTGLTPEEAWARIRAVRPFIRPTPVQVAQIERFAARADLD